jgi:ketosteroid isomerase-like protein
VSTNENRRIAIDFLNALGRGDLEALEQLMTDDIELETMGCSFLSEKRDRDRLIELVNAFHHFMTTPIEFEFESITAKEDRVALEPRSRATMVDGRPYRNTYHWLCWVDGGRIRKAREYMDRTGYGAPDGSRGIESPRRAAE